MTRVIRKMGKHTTMTNEQQNLMKELRQAIEANGFTFLRFMNCGNIAVYYLANNYKEDDYKTNYGYTTKYGYTIEINETYRSNGTNENKSCYIKVIKWNEKKGVLIDCTLIEIIKISQKDGQKKRQNAINKIIGAYYEAITK